MTNPKLRVLFEDESLIIVDKPQNSIVHGELGDDRTLLEQVRNHLEEKLGGVVSFLAPANRLDRNTMGPVVFSKNKKVAQRLRRLFSRCQVTKVYRAKIKGILQTPIFVEADIEQGSHSRVRTSNLKKHYEGPFPDKDTWFAERDYNSETISGTLIKPLSQEGDETLVEVHPWTGRKHQIRVICQDIGHPIIGDKKYNRIPGRYKRSIKRTDGPFTVPALLCFSLEIPALKIKVRTKFKLPR